MTDGDYAAAIDLVTPPLVCMQPLAFNCSEGPALDAYCDDSETLRFAVFNDLLPRLHVPTSHGVR